MGSSFFFFFFFSCRCLRVRNGKGAWADLQLVEQLCITKLEPRSILYTVAVLLMVISCDF